MKQTFTLVAAFTVLAAFALPEIQNFSVTQGNDRVLSVSFELSEKAIVTMDMTTNGVSIGADNYQTLRNAHANDGKSPAGKVTAAGQHLWTWRPNKEWPGYLFTNGEFAVSVKAWSLDSPPDYMVLDSATTSNATFYVSAADLPEGGLKTADPNDAEALAALLNDVYRTTKLVLRKIPAAGVKWRMGSPTSEADRGSDETPHYVTLTNDYYVSIYPVTYYQYAKFVSTSDASYTVMPKSWTSYINYRGAFNTGEYCWPENGHDVAPGSSFGLLRKKTGFLFDFLTEAEWEYACRAGTTGRWCDNSSNPSNVAWTSSSFSGTENGARVGLKNPNAWGLYDMHGNTYEWVLDQYGAYGSDSVISPVGATGNITNRVARGGTTRRGDKSSRSACRYRYDGTKFSDTVYGNGWAMRISCPAALPDWLR